MRIGLPALLLAAELVLLMALAMNVSAAPASVLEGNPASPVRVLIYEDLQCGDCARFDLLLEQKLLPRYGLNVAFIHRDFPLGKHDWARPAAIAARWVYEQDRSLGITFRRELMAEQNSVTAQNLKAWLSEFAARNNLDKKGILDALNDKRLAAEIDQELQGGVGRGVTRTPTVYVGGQPFVETILYDDLARAIDGALAK